MKIFILTGLLVASTAQAGLEWEKKEITLKVHPAQVSANAVYRFSNTGKDPVNLSAVKPLCGCLAPKIAKRTYAPGESGELTVTFDLRNRTGPQRKTTKVATGDGTETKLYIECNIPKTYDIAPVMMKWLKGNSATTKTAKLVNPNPEPIKLLSVASSHKDLPAVLKTIREGFEYEVIVTRQPGAKNARSVIRINTEPPPGQEESKTLKLYVHAQ